MIRGILAASPNLLTNFSNFTVFLEPFFEIKIIVHIYKKMSELNWQLQKKILWHIQQLLPHNFLA